MPYLDTRDLIARHETLTDEAEGLAAEGGTLDEADAEELAAISDLIDQIGERRCNDGITLIPEDEFEDYARELAEDIGAVRRNAEWPNNCIDWSEAADQLRCDYRLITFRGVDYLFA